METAGREIACEVTHGWAPADVFFVHDNGVGFDLQHAHRPVDVFQRLHGNDVGAGTNDLVSLAPPQKGSGIVTTGYPGILLAEEDPNVEPTLEVPR